MKKFLKFTGFIILAILITAYFCFLFVLPKVVDVNQYKPLLQKIVKEQANLNIDFDKIDIITTPLLSAGIKTNNITLKYTDGEELLTADSFKTKVSLPSLLLYTVKISCLEIENLKINLSIEDGKNLKILNHVDKIIENNSQNIGQPEDPEVKPSVIDVSKIRIKVPNAKFKNYLVKAVDEKNNHDLVLKGEELKVGYFNGKTAKIKTNAKIISDNITNVTANLDIDTFLPPPSKLDEEDDKVQRAELPYANIVELYRNYDLKTNIDSKLKIRKNKQDKYILNGHLNVDNLTLKLANYTLPESYAHLKFKGQKLLSGLNLSIENNQNINLFGVIDYSKNPKLDIALNSDKIYFKSLLTFVRGIVDSFGIKNDLASINTDGYIYAKTNIKTNFKKLKSDGVIYLRNGQFKNPKTGLNIEKANTNINLDNDILKIQNTNINIGNTPVEIQGEISNKSGADLKIKTQKLPLRGLYNTLAPLDLKKSYSINSGNITMDVHLNGKLKRAVLSCKAFVDDFSFSDIKKSIIITDDNLKAVFNLTSKEIKGAIDNSNLSIFLPSSKSTIKNKNIKIDVDNEKIIISPSKILLNNNSEITFDTTINNWKKESMINFVADGKLSSLDIKQLAGKDVARFINAKGVIPVKLTLDGDKKRQNLFLQIHSDSNNYVTPVNIESVLNKPSTIQTKIAFKGDRLKIKETGFFEETYTNDPKTGEQITKLNEIIGIEGTITHLKSEPFINLLTINIPKDLKISLNGFKRANLTFGGKLYTFGKTALPRFKGGFYIKDLKIDDLLTSLNQINIGLFDRQMKISITDLLLNGSDLDIDFDTKLIPSNIFTIENLKINSQNINVDKSLKVLENLDKLTPKTSSKTSQTTNADIPVEIRNGSFIINNLKSGNIELSNTIGKLSLLKNVLYLNELNTKAFSGDIFGDISMNLLSSILRIKIAGENINSEKAALDTANLKDVIFGRLTFNTDLLVNVSSSKIEEIMKSLDGTVDFIIQNGQLGPFGKLENMILAENIRESEFFKTSIGAVINNLTTIDTTHFDIMNGHLIFKDGILNISPVISSGNVLNMHLAGNMDLLKNTLDMKVRAKLGSEISNMLGPVAALNPINLVKATPGLNVVMAKAFILFCEEVTPKEMNVIPSFEDSLAETLSTKFQIILKGDVAKPLTLVKSFKWLVTAKQLTDAENFVASLPEPEVTSKGEVLQTPEEIENYNKKLSTKLKKLFKKENKKLKKNEETQDIGMQPHEQLQKF